MKILKVEELAIPEVKVITFQRFKDDRGYFTETYRKTEFETNPQTPFLKDVNFTQSNESFSKKNVFRGFHFQWNPYMAKMLRVISGSVIDMAIDIRPNSKSFGQIVGKELVSNQENESGQWIWVPVGFAHGIFFLEDSTIEYYCTGQWAPDTERAISPYSKDINWSVFDTNLKQKVDNLMIEAKVNDKDKEGMTFEQWKNSEESKNFI